MSIFEAKTPSSSLRKAARLMGKAGGVAASEKLTPEQRSLRAAHAHAVRFAKMTPDERSAEARRAINIRWARVAAARQRCTAQNDNKENQNENHG
jgi:hypothetical protein